MQCIFPGLKQTPKLGLLVKNNAQHKVIRKKSRCLMVKVFYTIQFTSGTGEMW